jgi:multidrug resistance efflux pump
MTEGQKQETHAGRETEQPQKQRDPVRTWTFIIFGACVVLMVLYLVADRVTPFTTQAKVHAYVVPIAPQVSGNVVNVDVSNNQEVEQGQRLLQIDQSNYQLAVEAAEAGLQAVLQAVDAGEAGVAAAAARVQSAQANVWRSEKDAERLRRIKQEDDGAVSDRRVEQAEASLISALGNLAAAEANLEAARRQLGDTGENNAQIQQARAALNQAQINLDRTQVLAPRKGLVTDLRIDQGNFAAAGAPLMTFIAIHDVWVQADLTENNLGNLKPGDAVEMVFDVRPGRVYKGRVRATGFGVQLDSNALGTLPVIENDRNWLRDAQRFPVTVEFDASAEKRSLRVGSQVSVIVYTGDNWLINSLGRLYIRLHALLSYAY